jgi:hypothetical protein
MLTVVFPKAFWINAEHSPVSKGPTNRPIYLKKRRKVTLTVSQYRYLIVEDSVEIVIVLSPAGLRALARVHQEAVVRVADLHVHLKCQSNFNRP